MLAKQTLSRPRNAWWVAQSNTIRLIFRAFHQEHLGSMTPVVVVLLFMALIFMLLTVSSVLAPFIYPLF